MQGISKASKADDMLEQLKNKAQLSSDAHRCAALDCIPYTEFQSETCGARTPDQCFNAAIDFGHHRLEATLRSKPHHFSDFNPLTLDCVEYRRAEGELKVSTESVQRAWDALIEAQQKAVQAEKTYIATKLQVINPTLKP